MFGVESSKIESCEEGERVLGAKSPARMAGRELGACAGLEGLAAGAAAAKSAARMAGRRENMIAKNFIAGK